MNKIMLNDLVCPKCKSPLNFNTEKNYLYCSFGKKKFFIHNGIPILIYNEIKKVN